MTFPQGYKTSADIREEIRLKVEMQDSLRQEIDQMPECVERDRKVDLIFRLHEEIAQLEEIQHTI